MVSIEERPPAGDCGKLAGSTRSLPAAEAGQSPLDRIDVGVIENLRDELRARLSAKSVNAVLTTTAAIFKLAVRRRLVSGNPAADAERAFMGAMELNEEGAKEQRGDGVQPIRPKKVLDPNEVRRMLEKAEPGFYRTLFLTAYLTGMRRGELFALKWSDIELKATDPESGQESGRGRIFVRRSLSWARVQREEGPVRPRFFPPKTKAGIRTLPIAAELAGGLRRWKPQCRESEHDLVSPMPTASPCIAARRCAMGYGRRFAGPVCGACTCIRCGIRLRRCWVMAGAPVTEVQGQSGTLQSGGDVEGLFALVSKHRDGFCGQVGVDTFGGLPKSWTLFGDFQGYRGGKNLKNPLIY